MTRYPPFLHGTIDDEEMTRDELPVPFSVSTYSNTHSTSFACRVVQHERAVEMVSCLALPCFASTHCGFLIRTFHFVFVPFASAAIHIDCWPLSCPFRGYGHIPRIHSNVVLGPNGQSLVAAYGEHSVHFDIYIPVGFFLFARRDASAAGSGNETRQGSVLGQANSCSLVH